MELEAGIEFIQFPRLEDKQNVDVGGMLFTATSLNVILSNIFGEEFRSAIDVDVEVEFLEEF